MQSKYIKRWFPPQERGRANAVWNIGTSLGPALAMPIFTWNISEFGWRSNFFFCLVLGLIPLYLLWFHTTDNPRQHKRVNPAELQLIEEALANEAKAVGEVAGSRFSDTVRLLARNYRFWLMIVYYCGSNCVFWGMFSWLPSYLKSARGFTWAQMGWLSSLPFVVAVVAKVGSGWLSDRVGRYAPFCLVAMLSASVCTYFAAVVHSNIASALLLALAMGGLLSGTPPAWTLLQALVPTQAMSLAAGCMNGFASAVSAASPLIIGILISFTGSYSGGLFFMVGSSLLAAATILVLVIQKK
jgi:sugar phosphate permease